MIVPIKKYIMYFLFFVLYLIIVSVSISTSVVVGYKLGRNDYPSEFRDLDLNLIAVIDDATKCIDDGNVQLALIKLGYINKCPRVFLNPPNSEKMMQWRKEYNELETYYYKEKDEMFWLDTSDNNVINSGL